MINSADIKAVIEGRKKYEMATEAERAKLLRQRQEKIVYKAPKGFHSEESQEEEKMELDDYVKPKKQKA